MGIRERQRPGRLRHARLSRSCRGAVIRRLCRASRPVRLDSQAYTPKEAKQHLNKYLTQAPNHEFAKESVASEQPLLDLQSQNSRCTELLDTPSGKNKSQWKKGFSQERTFGQNKQGSGGGQPTSRHGNLRGARSNLTAQASVSGLQMLGQHLRTSEDTTT